MNFRTIIFFCLLLLTVEISCTEDENNDQTENVAGLWEWVSFTDQTGTTTFEEGFVVVEFGDSFINGNSPSNTLSIDESF